MAYILVLVLNLRHVKILDNDYDVARCLFNVLCVANVIF